MTSSDEIISTRLQGFVWIEKVEVAGKPRLWCMPQVSGCVLALDTFTQDIILKEERVSLWHILEKPEKAGREIKNEKKSHSWGNHFT